MADKPISETIDPDLLERYLKFRTITEYISSAYLYPFLVELSELSGYFRKEFLYACSAFIRSVNELARDCSEGENADIFVKVLRSLTDETIGKCLTQSMDAQVCSSAYNKPVSTVKPIEPCHLFTIATLPVGEETVYDIDIVLRPSSTEITNPHKTPVRFRFSKPPDSVDLSISHKSEFILFECKAKGHTLEKPHEDHTLIYRFRDIHGDTKGENKGLHLSIKEPKNDPKTSEDELLMEKVKEDDRDAFRSIYFKYHSHVYTYCKKKVVDQSLLDEVVQDVFVSIWANRKQRRTIRDFRRFLFDTTKAQIDNYFLNKLKASRQHEPQNQALKEFHDAYEVVKELEQVG
jgi:hypothetical protein